MVDESDVDGLQKMCRYCFEVEGEMIAPCACTGGQKWVHFDCLLRWQQSLVEANPSIHAISDQNDRLDVCNVCLSPYTCVAPTRLDLIKLFTGSALVNMLDTGCIVASHHDFSGWPVKEWPQIPGRYQLPVPLT